MSKLKNMEVGDLFDANNRQFEPEDQCWKCGAPLGAPHRRWCTFDFCRRSGVQVFGDRPCYCHKGPQYNYMNGLRIGEDADAGRVDPPGSLVTAVSTPWITPIREDSEDSEDEDEDEDEDEEEEGSRRMCQFDVPWDGYAPETLDCKALGLLSRRRVARNTDGEKHVIDEIVDDPELNGVMPSLMVTLPLQNKGMLDWNSLLLRWQWSRHVTSLDNSARALARLALLSVKDRAAPREDAPKAMHVVHRLAASGHATAISSVLAFFRGEEKPWFYGGLGKIFEAGDALEAERRKRMVARNMFANTPPAIARQRRWDAEDAREALAEAEDRLQKAVEHATGATDEAAAAAWSSFIATLRRNVDAATGALETAEAAAETAEAAAEAARDARAAARHRGPLSDSDDAFTDLDDY